MGTLTGSGNSSSKSPKLQLQSFNHSFRSFSLVHWRRSGRVLRILPLSSSNSSPVAAITMSMEGSSKKVSVADVSKSDQGLLQSKDLYQYILNTSVYPGEPEVLKELRELTSTDPKSYMLTAADEGPLMSILLKLVNAKRTIELGVFTGYSLLLTALTIPEDGKIVAIDMNRETFEVGLPLFKKTGVEHKVEFIESKALPALDKLLEDPKNEGSFDYAFVDADKPNYMNYHERLMKLVRVGGVVLYDNTLWAGTVAWPDDSTLDEHMKTNKDSIVELNKFLASDPRIQISQLPIGDGLTVCLRR